MRLCVRGLPLYLRALKKGANKVGFLVLEAWLGPYACKLVGLGGRRYSAGSISPSPRTEHLFLLYRAQQESGLI